MRLWLIALAVMLWNSPSIMSGGNFISHSVDLGDGWHYSDWFGFYSDTYAPWFYHSEHGFIYLDAGSSDSEFYSWDPHLETWWYTREDLYPDLYAFAFGQWIYYFEGTAEPRVFHLHTEDRTLLGVTEGTLLTPAYKQSRVLIDGSTLPEKRYLAFPVLLKLDSDTALLGLKRGDAHAKDQGAFFEAYSFDLIDSALGVSIADFSVDQVAVQNGEWIHFPNGDVSLYVDVQNPVSGPTERLGLRSFRSTDGGVTFTPMGPVGLIDGIEYGYLFESRNLGDTTYAVIMTFDNFAGGRRSVDIISSADNGTSWNFVRNLTLEFGDIPINETSFLPYGEGFLVASRGYDGGVRLYRTDGSFRHLETAVLSSEYEFVARIGRPRLFEKEGRFYLMGRNYTQPFPEHPMQLCLFRIDPETLKIRSFAILDNAEQANVTDGYYAASFWNRRAGKDYFNVITYKGVDEADPDLFLFEFLWDEVR